MRRRLFAVLVLGSLVLASCGGGDEAPDADTGGGNGATSEAGATGASTGAGGVGAIDATRCAEVAQAMAAAAAAVPQAMTGTAADLETSVEQLQAFASAAPEEIRADVQTIAEGYAELIAIFQESGYDPTSGQPPTAEQIAALTAAAEQLETQEFQAAVDRVDAYFAAECGA
ncbi:MAG TPA: hypothetical protein VE669_10640 [Actinomycetota bacterium]|nr:hypothetical protein [Actinomycetota bacterium]